MPRAAAPRAAERHSPQSNANSTPATLLLRVASGSATLSLRFAAAASGNPAAIQAQSLADEKDASIVAVGSYVRRVSWPAALLARRLQMISGVRDGVATASIATGTVACTDME